MITRMKRGVCKQSMRTTASVAALAALMLSGCTAEGRPSYSTSWTLKFEQPVNVIATNESTALIYGKSSKMLFALDIGDGHRVWAKPMMPPPDDASVSGNNFALTQSVGDQTVLTALDAGTGDTAWQRTVDVATMLSIEPSGDVIAWVGNEIKRSDPAGILAWPTWRPTKDCTIVDAAGEGRAHRTVVALQKCDHGQMSVAVLSDSLTPQHVIKVAPSVQSLAKGGGAVGVNDVGGGWVIDTSAGRAVPVSGTLDAAQGMGLAVQEVGGALVDVRPDVPLHPSPYVTIGTSVLPLLRIEVHSPDGRVGSATTVVGRSQHLTRVDDNTYLFQYEGKSGLTTLEQLHLDSKPGSEPAQAATSQLGVSETIGTSDGQKLQLTNVGTDGTAGEIDTNIVLTRPAGGPELAMARLAIAATDADAVDAWRLTTSRGGNGLVSVPAGRSKVAGADKTTWAQFGRCLVEITHDSAPTEPERAEIAVATLSSAAAKECRNG